MTYDCSLYGIVVGEKQKTTVIQRLLGLCGNDAMVDLFEHEIVCTPTEPTPIGPARNDDVVLRLYSRISTEEEQSLKHRQWFMVMQGNPERGLDISVRQSTRVQLSGDVMRFMKSLGYSYSFGVAKKGHLLAYERDIVISVTQVFKLNKLFEISTATPFHEREDIWLIEVTAFAEHQSGVKQVSEQLDKLRELLSSTVDLGCVDRRVFRNPTS